MDVKVINEALSLGNSSAEIFPHLKRAQKKPFHFRMEFGLKELPRQGGVISVRGARQYGKSTWLEEKAWESFKEFGPGSVFYLNGDLVRDERELVQAIRGLLPLYSTGAKAKRLFIDEITAIEHWQKALKIMLDGGELEDVLVVTTGSKARDLRQGVERLPGRKGKLERTQYLFTPVGYSEFKRVCGKTFKDESLQAYLVSGGSPVALSEMAQFGRLAEYVTETTRDWIYGEVAAADRSRSSLIAVLTVLFARGDTALGQAKLAREAGLANNTVAAGYVELLADLLCLGFGHAWDPARKVRVMRKPCKFHFVNLLAAVAWHPSRLRSVNDFHAIPESSQGMWWEWLAAQELWRRRAIRGEEFPELLPFWQSKDHELDFVLSENHFLETKRGKISPQEFAWFPAVFPKAQLTVIGSNRFETKFIRGLSWEDFMLDESIA